MKEVYEALCRFWDMVHRKEDSDGKGFDGIIGYSNGRMWRCCNLGFHNDADDNGMEVVMRRTAMAKYRCPRCKKIVERDSEKGWIKSYCEKSGKYVRLQRVGDREEDGDGGKERIV